MLEKMLFMNYNKLITCENKELFNLNITKNVLDLRKYLNEIEFDSMDINNLSINLFIYGILYMNSNIKEIILEVFQMLKTDIEPEQELLVAGYMVEAIDSIKKLNPILNKIRIIIPYGVLRIKNSIILKTLACFEK